MGDFLKKKSVSVPCFKLVSYLVFESFVLNIYLFKINNRSTRKRCEICSKLTIKTSERRQLSMYLFAVLAHLVPENR